MATVMTVPVELAQELAHVGLTQTIPQTAVFLKAMQQDAAWAVEGHHREGMVPVYMHAVVTDGADTVFSHPADCQPHEVQRRYSPKPGRTIDQCDDIVRDVIRHNSLWNSELLVRCETDQSFHHWHIFTGDALVILVAMTVTSWPSYCNKTNYRDHESDHVLVRALREIPDTNSQG